MSAIWVIKAPTGLVNKKTLPYVSNYWRATGQDEAYFVGLTSDIGMRPESIWPELIMLIGYFEGRGIVLEQVTRNKTSDLNKTDLKKAIDNLGSDWYSDSMYLTGHSDDDYSVFIEPQSDGTEIGLFFAGKNAEQEHQSFLDKAQAQ